MTSIKGGPKQILNDIIKLMQLFLVEKGICIKIREDVTHPNELYYFWRVYKIMLFHYIQWAINLTKMERKIFVEISTHKALDGMLVDDA